MDANSRDHLLPLDSNQDLGSIISSNLKRLIAQNKTTQKELADRLGVAAASMTDLNSL